MTPFGNNTDYTAFLYAGTFNPAGMIVPSGLLYLNTQVAEHLPNNIGTLQQYNNNVYIAQGTGCGGRRLLSFELINNANGAVIGYFTWDSFITVNQG